MSVAKRTSRLVGLEAVSQVASGTVRGTLSSEGRKGCDPNLYPHVVDLEPPYGSSMSVDGEVHATLTEARVIRDPVIVKVWCPKDAPLMWEDANDFHKELVSLHHPLAFEVLGSSEGVWILLVMDSDDVPLVVTALEAEFPEVRLEELTRDPIATWLGNTELHLELEDFVPHPPFYRTMTAHHEIGGSPLAPIYVALSKLQAGEFAWYRVLSMPTRPEHNWHAEVDALIDAEHRGIHEDFFNPAVPTALLSLPSNYLPKISEREEAKANPDRPFFAVSIMTASLAPGPARPHQILRTLRTGISNFLYGAKPFQVVTKEHYLGALGTEDGLRRSLTNRATHRPGMLLNSLELSGAFHFPPGSVLEDQEGVFERIRGFEVPECLRGGRLLVGTNHYIGTPTPVFVPDGLMNEHMYCVGKSGTGKSTFFENSLLQEVEAGRGVALIEPHGDLTASVLQHIPRERVEDVVYVDFHDEDYVPCLNPFNAPSIDDAGRVADEITAAFRSQNESWGPRMENVLRQSCYALLHRPKSTLADIGLLLALTPEGDAFRREIMDALDNVDAIRFWGHVFPKYKADAVDPVTNKVSKLMLNTKIASVFSQPDAKVVYRRMMDEGKIFLMRLTGLGPHNSSTCGSFSIGGFLDAARSRSELPLSERTPFSLYIDEFHRFPTTSIEDLLVECRKFGLSVRLAHQESGQIDAQTRRAVGTADTIISFCVDVDDARHIARELRKEVKEEDLLALQVGEAFARIDGHIVDLRTPPPASEPKEDYSDLIIQRSREKYYVRRDAHKAAASEYNPSASGPRVFDTF